MRIAVTGAGGFLGGHLVKRLTADGHQVTAIGRRHRSTWWQNPQRAWIIHDGLDLRDPAMAAAAVADCDQVYHLAADMGGRAFTEGHDALCAMNSAMDLNMLRAAVNAKVGRYFYASTTCVYPPVDGALNEEMSEPYAPDGLYGWSKLYGEFSAGAFARDLGLQTRIARLDGVYGPHGAWTGGREKAVAALIRKAIETPPGQPMKVWGDGKQERAYLYVDDAVEAMIRLMNSEVNTPLNIGFGEPSTMAEIAALAIELSGTTPAPSIAYVSGPVGPSVRYASASLALAALSWTPTVSLRDGMARTMEWIREQMRG